MNISPTWPRHTLRRVVAAVQGCNEPFCMISRNRLEGPGALVPTFGTISDNLEPYRFAPGDGPELYMMVGRTHGAGMRVADVVGSRAVAVDLDEGLPVLCGRGQPLEPSLLVQTSPGRFHAVYLLNEDVDAEWMRRIAIALARRLGGDLAFARANQQMRLPNSPNQKHDDGWIELVYANGPRYIPKWLFDACDGALYEAVNARKHGRRDSPSRTDAADAHLLEDLRDAAMHLGHRGWAKDFHRWFKVLVNLASLGEPARGIADAFSRCCPEKYEPDAVNAKFNRLIRDCSGDYRAIFNMASREGWTNPGHRASGEPTANQLSERAFGRQLAEAMQGEFATLDRDDGGKGSAVLLKWTGACYEPLNDRERRAEIEAAGMALIKKGDAPSSDSVQITRRLGTNRSLDEVFDHVAEALEPISRARVVLSYPYLGVQNGVLNLLTRELVAAECRPISARKANVVYDPDARCPRFEAFLHQVFQGSQPHIRYVVALFGYALLGRPLDQIFPIFLGPRAGNGKSKLLEVMLDIFGDYGARVKTEALMQKSHVADGASPALAALAGKRLVVAAEPNDRHRFDPSLIKQLVGERKIQTRDLYKSSREMSIDFVLVVSANALPYVPSDDEGMWRRIKPVHFDRVFRGEEVDKELADKLLEERAGILNLLLRGLKDYQRAGLVYPQVDEALAQSLKDATDPAKLFVDERCEVGPNAEVHMKDLYPAFLAWLETHAEHRRLSKNELGQRLTALGYQKITRRNLPVYQGLHLMPAKL